METFQSILGRKLSAALAVAGLPDAGEVTPATDARFGDYQTNSALVLAKERGENPRNLAEKIIAHLDVSEWCDTPTVAGAGFINFALRAGALAAKTTEVFQDERLGVAKASAPHRIVIDFGSPNVAKPMHVGHIRSTVLGDALARIASFLGHDVIRDNHIGDWGTQFGMLLVGWKMLLSREALQSEPLAELERVYRAVNAKIKEETLAGMRVESLRIIEGDKLHFRWETPTEKASKDELVKLQNGDAENITIWKEMTNLSLQYFEEIYQVLDIRYDIQRGESFYNDRLADVVERLLKSGLAEISEGAVCVFFRDIPELAERPCIIRKSDGGYNYATTDLATVDYRVKDLKADTVWYVVGAPQILHFKQIFEIARREGYTADFRHIPFGSILGDDRKLMKTRSGESVPLRQVLDEAVDRARKIIEEKSPELGEAEKAEVARIIGIGAVKYADLSQFRMTDYIFSWDRMLSFQGNTAPYLQNAYVRIQSIFRKAGEASSPMAASLILAESAEKDLAKRLCQFAETVPKILNDFRPNILANYLFELANSFHAFYEACPVLKSEPAVRGSRLVLCETTARVLKTGLELLGIGVPQKM
jgi:arginyl-tRNA synthetase